MSIKAACMAIALFGAAVVTAAYICRGEWAVGSEYFLVVAVGAVITHFIREEEEDAN